MNLSTGIIFELLSMEDWNLSQSGCQFKMFRPKGFSYNFGSFTLIVSVGFEGDLCGLK